MADPDSIVEESWSTLLPGVTFFLFKTDGAESSASAMLFMDFEYVHGAHCL